MARYFAEVVNAEVVRVVVCDDPGYLADRLGGTWVETADPYTDVPQEVSYTGPGHGYDPDWPCRFAPKWVQPVAIPVELLEDGDDPWTWYHAGQVVWHAGHLWVSTLDQNVWTPGTSGWRRTPTRPGVPPQWTQPTGAHDAWQMGEHVMHGDVEYESQIDANTTTPGTDDRWWLPVT